MRAGVSRVRGALHEDVMVRDNAGGSGSVRLACHRYCALCVVATDWRAQSATRIARVCHAAGKTNKHGIAFSARIPRACLRRLLR